VSRTVYNVVARPTDRHVVGVEIRSKPVVLPLADGSVEPPDIPRCFDRHIFLSGDRVVTVEVMARVRSYPRQMTMDDVRAVARDTLVAELDGEPCSEVLEAMAQRLARKMLRRGVVVK
jgi:hypothetical protein